MAPPVRSWVAPELAGELPAEPRELLEQLFALPDGEALRRLPDRATLPWPGHPGRLVKRTVGGEARDFWHDRWRGIPRRSPARREAENLAALADTGLPVPRPLAWVEEDAAARHPRRRGRSALVLELLPVRASLREHLATADAGERRDQARRLLSLVTALHAAGWVHRDLYLQHLVLTDDPERPLALLDLGRARWNPAHRPRWFAKDLAALDASAPGAVTRAERLRFLAGWLAARGEEGAVLRPWARRIRRKASRLAAHRPRHLDPRDPVDRTFLGAEARP